MSSTRVLIIDGSEDGARTLAALLESAGYETLIASNGSQGLALFESNSPDAVILDPDLPETSGYEICRRLRAQASSARLLIIALTGWTRHSDRVAAYEAGCDHYVLKPASLDTLDTLLKRVERRRVSRADR